MHLRIALRQRWRDWPASLTFILILGLAVAVAGVWSTIAWPLLRGEMPYPGADRLFAVANPRLNWMAMDDSRSASVEAIAGYVPRTWGLQTDPKGHVEVVLSQQVTGEFFDVLGTRPALGEPLTRRHELQGNQASVWLSHGVWTRLLGGDGSALARTVWINAVPYRVAGVMPESFDFPHHGESPDIYIPLNRADFYARDAAAVDVIVRLRPGARVPMPLTPLSRFLLGERMALLQWLFVAVVILLLISMANASGVWLAQWLKQQRHAMIRRSLGASFSRVVLEQSVQALLLGAGAAGLGLLLVPTLLGVLRASPLTGPELARFELWRPVSIDLFIALGLVVLAVASSLVAAVLPMLMATRRSDRTRFALAVVQLTLTGTLAYSGILVWRNVQSLLNADRGFRTEQILVSGIGIPEAVYNTDEKMIRFHQRAIEELSRIPGVTAASGGASMPVAEWRTRFLLDDDQRRREDQPVARLAIASPGLLKLLQIPLRQGRGFDSAVDHWTAPHVALVNEAFVKRYGLGRRIRMQFYNGFAAKPYADHFIVGVVADTLNRDLALQPEPMIVISSDQIAMEGFRYFIQSSLPAASLKEAVAQAIWKVDPAIERVGVAPLSERLEHSLISRRALGLLLSWFGALALAIVGFGLASSLTATYLEMSRELGIRSALGATPGRLAFEATRGGALAIGLSWVLMFPLCWGASRYLSFDGMSWGMAAGVLGLIGLLAGWIPARRASSVDPAATLRSH